MRQNWEIFTAKAPFATFMQPLHFTIYDSQLQKALNKYFARSRSSEEPGRSHSTAICQRPSCKTQKNYAQRLHKLQLQNDLDAQAEKRRFLSTV